jgi:hypothetical protein
MPRFGMSDDDDDELDAACAGVRMLLGPGLHQLSDYLVGLHVGEARSCRRVAVNSRSPNDDQVERQLFASMGAGQQASAVLRRAFASNLSKEATVALLRRAHAGDFRTRCWSTIQGTRSRPAAV